MIIVNEGFALICMKCWEKDKSPGETHIHATGLGKGVFLEFICFRCKQTRTGRAMANKPKNKKELDRALKGQVN